MNIRPYQIGHPMSEYGAMDLYSNFIHLSTAMEIIYQTNRTMLFEEINPEKLD